MSLACQKEAADAAALPVPPGSERAHPAGPAACSSPAVPARHPLMDKKLQEIIERHFPDVPQVYVNREKARQAILEYAAWQAARGMESGGIGGHIAINGGFAAAEPRCSFLSP